MLIFNVLIPFLVIIFTGKNIDILDMDMKMEYGLMFFQVLAAEGTSPTSSLHLLKHYDPDTFVKGSGSAKVFGDTGNPIKFWYERFGDDPIWS